MTKKLLQTPVNSEIKNQLNNTCQHTAKAYKRRWWILTVYVLYAAANAFQWMEYAIIATIIVKYYNVTTLAVDWTSIMFMSVYPLAFIPVSYIIDKKGLRVAALFGGITTLLAGVIKLFSIKQDLFYIILIGQAIGSIGQVFILPLPPKIAAVWFKPSEVSTVCSVGLFGTQLGLALGFQIPTMLVKNDRSEAVIASGLTILNWSVVIFMIPVTAAIIFCFPRWPALPPSLVQMEERGRPPPTFRQFLNSFNNLLRKEGYIKHSIGYGINLGVWAVMSTFLNQFVLHYFPNSEEDAGRLGFLMVCFGMIGTILSGIYLDKSHRYKEVTLFTYYMTAVTVLGFTFAIYWKNKIFLYIAACVTGLFMSSYTAVGYEFAVELTFPHDESTATGTMNSMTQLFGIFLTIGLGKLNEDYGPLYCLVSQAILLLIGAVLTQTVPNKKCRQEAFMKSLTEGNLIVNS